MIPRHTVATVLFAILVAGLHVSSAKSQFVVAHRGASYDAPENTLAAFELAWQQNADAIEADFYLTKDQQIVCIHDKSTKRVAPDHAEMVVAETSFEKLRELDVGKWKDKKFTGQRMPTLAEVLATVPDGKKIFVEIKCGPEIVPIMKPQLEQSGLRPEQITVICFNQAVVQAVRVSMPQYRVNWLCSYKQDKSTGEWSPQVEAVVDQLKKSTATGLGTNGNREVVTKPFIDSILKLNCEVHVWTINDPKDAVYFAKLGALSITTDRPALIREAIDSIPK